ncbi:hypothetical protein D3C86_1861790 [compost metagenome]
MPMSTVVWEFSSVRQTDVADRQFSIVSKTPSKLQVEKERQHIRMRILASAGARRSVGVIGCLLWRLRQHVKTRESWKLMTELLSGESKIMRRVMLRRKKCIKYVTNDVRGGDHRLCST